MCVDIKSLTHWNSTSDRTVFMNESTWCHCEETTSRVNKDRILMGTNTHTQSVHTAQVDPDVCHVAFSFLEGNGLWQTLLQHTHSEYKRSPSLLTHTQGYTEELAEETEGGRKKKEKNKGNKHTSRERKALRLHGIVLYNTQPSFCFYSRHSPLYWTPSLAASFPVETWESSYRHLFHQLFISLKSDVLAAGDSDGQLYFSFPLFF